MLDKMTSVITTRGMGSVALVSADDGLDELSLGAVSNIRFVRDGVVREERLDARELLGVSATVEEFKGGDVYRNVEIVRSFLSGKINPVFHAACANAGLALMVANKCETLVDGYELAKESVLSGSAQRVLERLVAVTND
jgi:anthranilate phosphoribosyltransferase